ncbi:MAG: tetratricopeptide repeat protein [bacterium]
MHRLALFLGLFFSVAISFAAVETLPISLSSPQGWCTKAAAQALTEFRAHAPSDTNALLESLISTGQALELADETTEAARLYGQAIMLARSQIQNTGTNKEASLRSYIQSLIHLGGVAYDKTHYEEAEKLCHSAVEAARLTLPEKDLLVKIARNRYALALGQRYQPEQRRALYLSLEASCVKAFGKRHEETALVLDELAAIAMITSDYKQAASYAAEALKIRRRLLSTNHPRLADSINHLASVDFARNNRSDMVPLLKEALKIRTEAFGPDHPKTALSRKNLELFGSVK